MTRLSFAAAAGALGLLTALLAGGSAHAQQNDISLLPEDPATSPLRCLQQPAAPIEYPAESRRLELGGTVRVGLSFGAADRAPDVEVLARFADERIVNAVRAYVAAYRLPCHVAGQAPLRAVQTFIFRPHELRPVTWSLPVSDEDPARQRAMRSCLRTPADKLELHTSKFDRKTVSNTFVRLTFTAPDQPPQTEVLYGSTSGNTQDAFLERAREYRLPCLAPDARPVTFIQQFVLRVNDAGRSSFKDEVSLGEFLSNIKGIREQQADFDFNTMNCPFTVAWSLGKPAMPNRVGEIGGGHDSNRTEFLAWLAGLEMDLKPERFERLLGRTVRINVGCGPLRLQPAATTGAAAP
ncbi:hypothetical protein ACQ859_00270 [Roseateles chitinivorans]|uniref:hypothetical protein n=1 Tax=Roseateles chitinivorans TaxID=2917965 RepID=UPI003D6736BE